MSRPRRDSFWLAGGAWRHAGMEGLRVAAIAAITVFAIRSFGWIFYTDEQISSWLISSAKIALLIAAPFLPTFAIWTRWEIWHNNQVKPQ